MKAINELISLRKKKKAAELKINQLCAGVRTFDVLIQNFIVKAIKERGCLGDFTWDVKVDFNSIELEAYPSDKEKKYLETVWCSEDLSNLPLEHGISLQQHDGTYSITIENKELATRFMDDWNITKVNLINVKEEMSRILLLEKNLVELLRLFGGRVK